MSRHRQLEIETLSPIRIGSGEVLRCGWEFVVDDPNRELIRLDEARLLAELGSDRNAVEAWTAQVQRGEGHFSSWVHGQLPDLDWHSMRQGLAQPLATGCPPPGEGQEWHRHIQDGTGQPLLPGSTVKGALRTTLFAMLVEQAFGKGGVSARELKGRWRGFSDKQLMRKLLGENANQDIMRFLQVGDAVFERTETTRIRIFNHYRHGWKYKPEKFWAEVIPSGQVSQLRLHLPLIRGHWHAPGVRLPTLRELLQETHRRSRARLEDEIEFWEGEGPHADIESLLDQLYALFETTQNMGQESYLCRMAYGIGFHGMTGSVPSSRLSDRDWQELKRQVRGNRYEDYVLPKTIRLAEGAQSLGWTSLRLLD